MSQNLQTPVLIIGSGPVGMTLAMDLAQRGVACVVAEQRTARTPPSPKCNHVSARTMETFRRLGIVGEVRDAGLPHDYPNDVAYRLSFTGEEISRIPIPAREERYSATEGPDTWWPTPEPPHRINQIYLEPVLKAHVLKTAGVTALHETEVLSYTQDEQEVVAQCRSLVDGSRFTITAQYLVGCDGGRSMVRKTIGASLQGTAVVSRVQSTYLRAPDLLARMRAERPAWATFSVNTRRSGNVYAIDGKEHWIVHNYLRDDEPDFDAVDRDSCLRAILGVDADFQYEMLSKEDWFGRKLIADKFRDRRAFICGDAAHLWVPMAGYGMNAGIADAMNLSWMLAAHLNGWAGEAILDAHERERKPITEQVGRFAMGHAQELMRKAQSVPAHIEDDTPEGAAARESFGKVLYELNVQQYCCAGLNFGYYYDDSPLIGYDGTAQPGYSMGSFEASTVPGCRTPHVWLDDGRSLYDAMGTEYTLLCSDLHLDTRAIEDAARSVGMPLKVLRLAELARQPEYTHRLVLSRPDFHVGWRGQELPADSLALVNQMRGAL
jgi:2-polyprenyl-6-methoxyphenol hydroxylase-like FAD-dependent oxidoreductase